MLVCFALAHSQSSVTQCNHSPALPDMAVSATAKLPDPDLSSAQVILAYGLRSALQLSWLVLQSSAKRNCQSVEDAHVLLDVTRLLQELDVADDGTKPAGYHTQERMREVFGMGEYRHEHARNLLQEELCKETASNTRRYSYS